MPTKHLLKVAGAIGAAALVLAGCSSSGGSSSPSASGNGNGLPAIKAYAGPVGAGEGALNVLDWPGYAMPQWVKPFEQQTGCKVNVKDFGTSDEAVQLMHSGGYDVVSASGDATLRLIYGGTVQPVNTSLVPNYADVNAQLKNQPFNTVAGINYGIPHGRGANVLEYNTTVVKPAPTSWNITWEKNSPYAGKITAYDSPIFIADAAIYLMAHQPSLGIKDPYALDQTQFDAAMALLKQQKPMIEEYWGDATKQISAFSKGTLVAGTSWQYNVFAAQANKAPVSSVLPSEGATGWSDTWMVAAKTQHINCAYKWLDWIISPKVNAQVAEYFGEAPSNNKSCAYTQDKTFCAQYHATDAPYWKKVWFWTTPTAKCLDGRTNVQCVPYDKWSIAWSTMRSS